MRKGKGFSKEFREAFTSMLNTILKDEKKHKGVTVKQWQVDLFFEGMERIAGVKKEEQ